VGHPIAGNESVLPLVPIGVSRKTEGKRDGSARGSARGTEAQAEAASQPREKGAFEVTADPGYGDRVLAVRLKARESGASVARRED